MKLPIFLDNHSTNPMDPRVLETMLPYFVEKFGNAVAATTPSGGLRKKPSKTLGSRSRS